MARKRERKDSITFRCPTHILDALDDQVDKINDEDPRNQTDRSKLIIKKIQLADEFESLMKIYNDPEKRAEFESQMLDLTKTQNIERYLETIADPQRLKDIAFFANNQHDKRMQQIRFQVATR